MNFEDFDILKDLSINRYQLDLEAISLPSIYFRYSDAVREAKEIVSEKKDTVDAVVAEREIAIREQRAADGIKVTEGIIKAMVNSDKEVLEAKRELRDAMATHGRLQVALSALETKRNEIDNLVKLYCNAYYANKEPTSSSGTKDEMISWEMRKGVKPVPQVT